MESEAIQKVLLVFKNRNDNISFNDLKRATGLDSENLSRAVALLAKENKIVMRMNFLDNFQSYKSSAELLYSRFMDLLSKNYKQERKVSFYASKLCVTPQYLTATIKRVSASPPSVWIRKQVMKEIEYRLLYTQTSIKEIAYELNFPNVSFFGKYFKEQKGISPKYYREKISVRYTS